MTSDVANIAEELAGGLRRSVFDLLRSVCVLLDLRERIRACGVIGACGVIWTIADLQLHVFIWSFCAFNMLQINKQDTFRARARPSVCICVMVYGENSVCGHIQR